MKKLFTMLAVCLCSTMAYAQSIILSEVDLTPGETQDLLVLIGDPDNYTAFQFDLTLPKGVSVKDAKLEYATGEDRKLEKALVDAGSNKYRFLSYDMKNAKFGSLEAVTVILEAAGDAVSGNAETADVLYVDPEGTSTTVENDLSGINVNKGVSITIPAGMKLAMVSDKDLDFTSLEAKGVKAYICTGYEIATKKLWMTRVNDVPANTPILVKGGAGDYTVPVGTSKIYYPQNFLLGSAIADATVDKTAGFINYGVSQSSGNIGPLPATTETFGKGKAYFHVPASVASNVASSDKVHFEMGAGGKLAMVSIYDLDFTESEAEGLKAYTVTGFDSKKTIWLTRVMTASAGTPLLLRGAASGKYDVKSSAVQMAYVNMLDGNTGDAEVTLSPVTDGSVIYVLSLGSGSFGPLGKEAKFAKGKAWLPVPKVFHDKIAASTRGMSKDASELEAEVMCLFVDANTTAIDKIAAGKSGDDAWYNLNGQRINTPTKKGLYIKNGVKVIVK